MTTLTKKSHQESASYRDPDAFIFYSGDSVYRKITAKNKDFILSLIKNSLLLEMMQDGSLIRTWLPESTKNIKPETISDDDLILEHEKLDLLTFPHEWCTMQLFDAALFTLDMQMRLLDQDLALKDATPYNIQFLNNKPIFIDFTSLGANKGRKIWLAYNQFLEMFYYPLLLKVEKNLNNKKTYVVNFNGIKVEETRELLGTYKSFIRHTFDVGLPYFFRKQQKQARNIVDSELEVNLCSSDNMAVSQREKVEKQKSINLQVQKFALNSLKNKLENLQKQYLKSRKKTIWSDYTDDIHYGNEGYKTKKAVLNELLTKLKPKKLIDLGSNTGEFSEIAEKAGAEVLSIDLDHDCIEKLYLKARDNGLKITSIWSELDNLSPSIGWRNQERKALLDRITAGFQADTVFALALMHHLLISSRIPLDEMIDFFASLTTKFLVLEYVGPEDKMFQETLGTREDIYGYLNEALFTNILDKYFKIIDIYELSNGRKVFALEKK